jgi:16S rRNA processing protein RimM
MLTDLEDDEYYYHQLEDMEVYNGTEFVGKVIEVRDMPSTEMLVVRTESKQVYIPFVDEFIKDVNIAEGKIIIEAIEGLL